MKWVFNYLIVFLFSATLLVGCKKEPVLEVSQTSLNITGQGGTQTIFLSTKTDWTASLSGGDGWCTITPTGGYKLHMSITVNIKPNNTFEARECIILVLVAGLSKTITINQQANEPGIYWVTKMGTLNTLLNQTQKDTISKMVIKGEINKADFDVLKNQMPKLIHLDIKEVKCENDEIPYEAFGNRDIVSNLTLQKIIFPESITKIGDYAFSGCFGLKDSIILPSSITYIGEYAFSSCRGLTGTLILPHELTTIGKGAFSRCYGFTGELKLPSKLTNVGIGAFQYCRGFTGALKIPNSGITFGMSPFRNCIGFTSLVLPSDMTEIDDGLFSGCSGLTGTLNLPSGLTKIGSSAFSGCTGFTGTLNLPPGLTTIESGVLAGCSGFTGTLNIPSSVTSIGASAFAGCTGFTGVLSIPLGVTNIGASAFAGCTGFTGSLNIPSSVLEIGGAAFYDCTGFTGTLNLSSKLIKIDSNTFTNCTGFTGELTLPKGITIIRNRAFQGCSGFNGTLNLPSELIAIEDNAFEGCSNITKIIMGDNLESIGEYAFYYCRNISGDVIFPISINTIKYGAFFHSHKVSAYRFPHKVPIPYENGMLGISVPIQVPSSAVSTYKSTPGWKDRYIVGY